MTHKFDPTHFHKLENPDRYKELSPKKTLRNFGLKKGMSAMDIGAGTGFFTFNMAEIVGAESEVYATDIEQIMIDEIHRKINENGVQNIFPVLIKEGEFGVDKSVDFVLLSFVMHEFENVEEYLQSIFAHQNQKGIVAVVEWKKKETPKGPPVHHRISEDECAKYIASCGWKNIELIEINENVYGIKARKL
jgi:ubiquinone/menaquinone biosynthesis C-methylase UbiE